MRLSDPITSIPFIGPAQSRLFKKIDICSVEDLLHHYPRKYLDRTQVTSIANLIPDQKATIIAAVVSFKNIYTKYRKNIQLAVVKDNSGSITITWFNQPFLSTSISEDKIYAFSGKVKFFRNHLTLSAPEFELHDPATSSLHTGRLVPMYPETAGISSKRIRSRIKYVLEHTIIEDHLPETIKSQYHLINLQQALQHIHFPNNLDEIKLAKHRLAFDELFLLQLQGVYRRHQRSQQTTLASIKLSTTQLDLFITSLPFTLTKTQHQAINDIIADLNKTTPMNRLLEGDVGSGKTVVAAAAAFAMAKSGFSTLVMAPTELLANQLFQSLAQLLKPHQLKVTLLTRNNKDKSRSDVTVGTHALLFNLETSSHIGLIIIDEQHRFGVEQRAKLERLGKNPHRLTMSATPIPRTIALTLYGDLDISILDELPTNRKPIKTWLVPHTKRQQGYKWIKDQIDTHHIQAYVVCPLIEESDSIKLSEVKSATQEYDYLKTIFTSHRLALLHGRIKSQDKERVLAEFKAHQHDLLVTTPVIEVGIDVPNATIIVIEAAERFGLAQLHQLRGRVGRGDRQSYCLLFTSTETKTDNTRLTALTKETSGFVLAQQDLKLRGPGEVFGLTQHGFRQLKIARFTNQKLLRQTKDAATELISKDPGLVSLATLKTKLTPSTSATTSN